MTMSPTCPIQIYLTVRGGADAVAWYEKVFGAIVTMRKMADDRARLLHATLAVFGAEIMLSDEFPEYDKTVVAPPTLGGTSVTTHVNLPSRDDVVETMAKAAQADATVTMGPDQMPWGAFNGRLIDPFGHSWSFGTA